jgi:hypothetical protein
MALGDRIRADELEWLQFFYENADFGPAHEDVVMIIEERFLEQTGKILPKGYGSQAEVGDDEA